MNSAQAPPRGVDRYLVDAFDSPDGLLDLDWLLEPFDGVPETCYVLEQADGEHWLHGSSDGAAALLTHPVNLDLADFPRLRWRWRTEQHPEGADLSRKDGDDCGARVFVTFAYDPTRASLSERIARSIAGRDLPGSALCYVWDASLPAETCLPNPHASHTRVIVVRSGPADPGHWHLEERDLSKDYIDSFGTEAPQVVGVALMVDTDQTGSSAKAAFDDIEFLAPAGR